MEPYRLGCSGRIKVRRPTGRFPTRPVVRPVRQRNRRRNARCPLVRLLGDPGDGGSVSGTPEDRSTGCTSGAGFRGGNWNNAASYLRAADRNNAANTNAERNQNYGGRGVRLAPRGVEF